jgi:hypothetical protein
MDLLFSDAFRALCDISQLRRCTHGRFRRESQALISDTSRRLRYVLEVMYVWDMVMNLRVVHQLWTDVRPLAPREIAFLREMGRLSADLHWEASRASD